MSGTEQIGTSMSKVARLENLICVLMTRLYCWLLYLLLMIWRVDVGYGCPHEIFESGFSEWLKDCNLALLRIRIEF